MAWCAKLLLLSWSGILLHTCCLASVASSISKRELQQQQNDDCTAAEDIDSLSGNVRGELAGAAAIPSFAAGECSVDLSVPGLWYRYKAASSDDEQIVEFTVDELTVLQDKVFMVILDGSDCNKLVCAEATAPSFFKGKIDKVDRPGVDFFIFVSGQKTENRGAFLLQVQPLSRPSNDQCLTAQNLAGRVKATNKGAIPSFSDPTCGITMESRGLWYSYTSAIRQNVRLVFTDLSLFEVVPLQIAVFEGNSCDSLQCLVSRSSGLDFVAEPNQVYHILVFGPEFYDTYSFTLQLAVCVVALDCAFLWH